MNAREADPKIRPTATTAAAKRRSNGPTNHRPAPTWHAVATATQVTARTSSCRWLLVYRCPACPLERHLAQTKTLQEVVVRKTACGSGLVALHVALGSGSS